MVMEIVRHKKLITGRGFQADIIEMEFLEHEGELGYTFKLWPYTRMRNAYPSKYEDVVHVNKHDGHIYIWMPIYVNGKKNIFILNDDPSRGIVLVKTTLDCSPTPFSRKDEEFAKIIESQGKQITILKAESARMLKMKDTFVGELIAEESKTQELFKVANVKDDAEQEDLNRTKDM